MRLVKDVYFKNVMEILVPPVSFWTGRPKIQTPESKISPLHFELVLPLNRCDWNKCDVMILVANQKGYPFDFLNEKIKGEFNIEITDYLLVYPEKKNLYDTNLCNKGNISFEFFYWVESVPNHIEGIRE